MFYDLDAPSLLYCDFLYGTLEGVQGDDLTSSGYYRVDYKRYNVLFHKSNSALSTNKSGIAMCKTSSIKLRHAIKSLVHRAKVHNLIMGYDSSFLLAAQIFHSASLGTNLLITQDLKQSFGEFCCIEIRRCGSAPIDTDSEPFHPRGAVICVEPLREDDLRDAHSVQGC